jgi:toxin ParE1/3/4
MAATLIWTESALADVEGIVAYIGRDSPHYAALTAERIVESVERLGEFPLQGRVVPEFDDPDLREVFWRDYRIVYRVESDRVAIVAVVHGARRIMDALGDRP